LKRVIRHGRSRELHKTGMGYIAHALYFACEAPIPFALPLVLMACHVLRSQNKELPSCSTYVVPRELKHWFIMGFHLWISSIPPFLARPIPAYNDLLGNQEGAFYGNKPCA